MHLHPIHHQQTIFLDILKYLLELVFARAGRARTVAVAVIEIYFPSDLTPKLSLFKKSSSSSIVPYRSLRQDSIHPTALAVH